MAQRSHVPKFGNWDGDNNMPYTAFFDNARKEKAGGGVNVRINPNDPEQNSDAFDRHRMASESANSSANSVVLGRNRHQRKMSDSRVPPSPFRVPNKPTSRHPSDDFSGRSVSVPKFGAWDEMDPRSADGFTVIFNKVKEEKQIASTKFPALPPWTSNGDHGTNQKSKETRSKRCCCFF